MTELKDNVTESVVDLAQKAKAASLKMVRLDTERKNEILKQMAADILKNAQRISKANAIDLENAQQNGLSSAMIDRLCLSEDRIEAMSTAVLEIAELADPVGTVLEETDRPNGLKIVKKRVPIGVIGIIYESRPNVTVDVAALCIKSGNAVILKGGKEAFHSNREIVAIIKESLQAMQADTEMVQFIPFTERQAVQVMLGQNDSIDLIIPRGGLGLIKAVAEHSSIPVLKHLNGICHVFVDDSANLEQAKEIVINAKCQRPGVCNALETLLVHESVATEFLSQLKGPLLEQGVELRACEKSKNLLGDAAVAATEEDWQTEYLDLILSIKIVSDTAEAIEHINRYGSAHSDAIITHNDQNAADFLNEVDSSTVYHNASTRFTDGGAFGKGAEMGISTDKLHARGPVGLEELTSYKYLVYGQGQTR